MPVPGYTADSQGGCTPAKCPKPPNCAVAKKGHPGCEKPDAEPVCQTCASGYNLNGTTCARARCRMSPICETPAVGLGCELDLKKNQAPEKCAKCLYEFVLDKNGICQKQKCKKGQNLNETTGGCMTATCPLAANCKDNLKAVEECEGDNPPKRCQTCVLGHDLSEKKDKCSLAICGLPPLCDLPQQGVNCTKNDQGITPKKCKKCSSSFILSDVGQCIAQKCKPGQDSNSDGGCDMAVCSRPAKCTLPMNNTAECEKVDKQPARALCAVCDAGYDLKKTTKFNSTSVLSATCSLAKCRKPEHCEKADEGTGFTGNMPRARQDVNPRRFVLCRRYDGIRSDCFDAVVDEPRNVLSFESSSSFFG